MVHPAGRIPVEESTYWRCFTQRLEQFDLGVGELDKDDRDPMGGQRVRLGNPGAQRLTVDGARGGKARDHDRNMVQSPDHMRPPFSRPAGEMFAAQTRREPSSFFYPSSRSN